MVDFKIPFSGRAHAYTSEEVDVVVKAMQTANPLTQGEYLKVFEDKFFDNMVSFPFHFWMTDEERDYTLQSTCEVLKEIRK